VGPLAEMTGLDLIAEARKLVGAPFFHGGRNPETGLDCCGVILVPARKLGLTEFEPLTYSPGGEVGYLLGCLARECIRVDLTAGLAIYQQPDDPAIQPGDIGLFAVRNRLQHLAYLTGLQTMIHANEKAGVRESVIDDAWQERLVSVWRWKGLAC
jgi:cell wall-associated NlpC family hydrolase